MQRWTVTRVRHPVFEGLRKSLIPGATTIPVKTQTLTLLPEQNRLQRQSIVLS